MSDPFELSPDPLPSKRTLTGRKERKTPGFQRARKAYLSVRAIKRAILKKRPLPESRHEELGVSSLSALLLRLRDDLRRLLAHYGETTIHGLFSNHYGRTPPCFQFHHKKSPRAFEVEKKEERNRCFHVSNLSLVTAEENLEFEARARRGEDDPSQLWLFPNLRHDA